MVARGEDGTWTNPAGGSWTTASNWAGGVIANDWFYTADFSTLNLNSNATVSLNGARSITKLVFGDTTPSHDWTLATGSAGPLTLVMSPEIEVKNRTATVSAVLTGSSGLSKTGPGTLVLGAINTYTFDTWVQGGELRLAANSGNSGTIRGNLTIYPGASVVATVPNALGYGGNNWVRSLRIQEGGSFTTTANGDQGWGLTVNLDGGTLAATGTGARFSAGGGTNFYASGTATTSVISGQIQLRENNPNNLVTFGVGDGEAHPDLDFTGSISSTTSGRGIQKGGNGTMRMTGTSSMAGPANVTEGTLVVDGTLTATTIPVSAPATLAGSGTISGPVSMQGTLSPGDGGIGTLRFTGALTLSSGSTTRIELRKTGSSLSSDRIQGGTSLALGGTLAVTVAGDAVIPGDFFTILSANQVTGSFATLNLPSLPGGLTWDTSLLSSQGKLTIAKAIQTITFAPLADVTLGDPALPLAATATSGLPVSFASSNPDVATVDGNVVTLTGSGYTTITASQAGNSTYSAAPAVPRTLAVNKAVRDSQAITFQPPATVTLATQPFALTASSSSGLPVTLTSSRPDVATLNGNVLTIVGAGTTTLTARQVGNTDYLPAPDETRVLAVTGTPQTITFAEPERQVMGNRPLELIATATSGLPVTFSSSAPSTASVSGNLLTIHGPGTITLTAYQPGNAIYDPAPEVSHLLTIDPDGVHLGVTPRSLQLALRSGEKTTAPLALSNPASGALDWDLSILGSDGYPATLDGALTALLDRQSNLIAALPANAVKFDGGITGTSINALPLQDANQLSTDLGGALEYSDRLIRSSSLFGPDGRYFTLKLPGLFLLGAEANGPTRLSIAGNTTVSNTPDLLKFPFTHGGRSWLCLATRRTASTYYSIDHVVLIDDPLATQAGDFTINLNFSGKRRLYYAMFVTPPNTTRSNAVYETLGRTILEALPELPPGLSVAPATGKLAPGATTTSTLTVDTFGWPAGDYRFLLDPRPGDANAATRRIPVDVAVSEASLKFPVEVIRRTSISGGPVEDYDLRPTSTTGSPVAWSASIPGNPPWVTLTRSSGTTPDAIQLRFDPTKVPGQVGILRTELVVTAAGATYLLPVSYIVDSVSIGSLVTDPVHSVVYGLNNGAFAGALVVIDPSSAAVTRVVETGPGACDLSLTADASRAYVINQGNSTVTGIDLTTLSTLGTITVPGTSVANSSTSPRQIAAGSGTKFFCTDTAFSPNLSLIDFANGQVLSSIAASSLPTGNSGGFNHLHHDFAEKRLYYTRRNFSIGGRRKVGVIDTTTDTMALLGEFPATITSNFNSTFAPLLSDLDGRRFFCSMDVFSRPLGAAPAKLMADANIEAISAYGHLVSSSVGVYHGETGAQLATLPTGYWYSAFTPDQTALILTNNSAPYLRRFDLPAAIRPPAIAIRPNPADGVAIEENATELTWSSLSHVDGYRIFLGTDRDAVAAATPGHPSDRGIVVDNSFPLSPSLAPGFYFWRIDAIRGGTAIPGAVTSFGVAPFRVTPASIRVQTPVGALPQEVALQATDTAGQPVAWTATTSTPWITLPQGSGAAGSPVVVRLNPSGLAAGIQQGVVRVSGMGLTLEIPVTLDLFAANLGRLKPDPSRDVIYGLQFGQTSGSPGHVVAIDAASGSYLRSFALDHAATDFAVHPLEDRIYVPAAQGNKITVIDLATWSSRPSLTLSDWTRSGRVYPGRAGRLLLEDTDFAPQSHLIDTATGNDLGTVPTGSSHSSKPLAVVSPDGTRIYRSAPAKIQPVDLSTEPMVAFAPVSVPTNPSESPGKMARSYDGSRTSVDNLILGPQLQVVGYGPSAIDALTRDGRLAVHPGGMFWTDSGFPFATYPAGYSIPCLSRDDRFVVAWDAAQAKAVSIPVGDTTAPTPLPGATLETSPAELSWPVVAGATSYHVYLGNNQAAVTSAGTGSPLRIATTTGTSTPLANALPYGFRYYWRIDAVTPSGTVKGTVYQFDVSFPQAFPAIQAPAGAVLGGSFAVSPTGELASAANQRISIYEPQPAGGFRHRETLVSPEISSSNNDFGTSLAFGHGIIAAGDTGVSSSAIENVGAVYPFKASPSGAWYPDKPLQPASPEAFSYFGKAVAFASNLLLVSDGTSGRNRVIPHFQWPAWKTGPSLTPTPRIENDGFGAALALDGTRAIVGAPGNGSSIQGSAFVFDYDPSTKSWLQRARLQPSDGSPGDMAGGSVTLSGDFAAIGSGDWQSVFDPARRVQIYQRASASSWTRVTTLIDPQPGAGTPDVFTGFGQSILLHGNLLFVSAPYAEHGGKPGGVIHVYRRSGTTWNTAPPISPPAIDSTLGARMAYHQGVLFVSGVSNITNNSSKPCIFGIRIEDNGNLPPRFLSDPPIQIVAGKAVDLQVRATDDQDPAALAFGQANLPTGLSFTATGEGTARIHGITTAAAGSEHWLRIPVSDALGLQTIQTAHVTILSANEAPVLASLPPTQEVEDGEDLQIQPMVTGTAPFTWRWQKDGSDLPDQIQPTLAISEANETHAGRYRVIVTNAAGSATSTEVVVTIRAADRIAIDWTTFGSGTDHDGYQAATLGRHRFAASWIAEVSSGDSLSPVTGAEGKVFVVRRTGSPELRAYSLGDGQQLWSRPLGANYTSSIPGWWDGKLFMQHADSTAVPRLWSIAAQDGSTLWHQQNSSGISGLNAPFAGAAGVFASSTDGFRGFDSAGTQRFLVKSFSNQGFVPALSNGRLFTWMNGMFAERDPVDGATIWSLWEPSPNQTNSPVQVPVIQGDKACVIDTYSGQLRCIDLRLRRQLWWVPYASQGAPAISGNRVFILSGTSVRELSLEDGSVLAVHGTDAPSNLPLIGQPLLLNDHWIVTNPNKTWIFHRATGALVQTLPHGGVASYAGNRLLLACTDGRLRAYLANGAPEFTGNAPAAIDAGDEATSVTLSLADFVSDADPGDTPRWAIESVSNPELFRSIGIDATSGDLSVEYNPWTSGSSDVVVTATDTAGNVSRQTIRFTLPALPEPDLLVAATFTLNRQTGLYEHRITITNAAAREIAGFDLAITGLPTGVTVNNASASEGGTWSIHHRQPLAAGASVTLLAEYYTPVRGTVITPEVTVSLVSQPETDPATEEAGLAVERCEMLPDRSLLIEFTSTPGQLYEVQYSDNAKDWKISPVKVRAAGNRVQWIDRGPPRTDSPPGMNSRFYRVREIPAP